MALFGRADKELPLLTQVYQVDRENREEIIDFAYPQSPNWSCALDMEDAMLRDTQIVIELAYEVMNTLCDSGGVTRAQLLEVQRQVNKARRHYDFPNAGKEPVGWDDVIPVGKITAGYNTEHLPDAYGETTIHTEIIHELDRLIVDMSRGKASVARCVECRSVYVVLRKGQQFCSHRCGNRVSKRERFKSPNPNRPRSNRKSDFQSHTDS
jgi:hypothetical protein